MVMASELECLLLLVEDGSVGQLVRYEKNFGYLDVWELNPEGLGSLWAGSLCDFGGNHFGSMPP
jgi:hypothetical protein